jgi:hypothetical protein
LQTGLSSYLHVQRKRSGISVFVEQRVRVSATRYRVPDICVTLGEPEEQAFAGPPFRCIEILSPEDRADRVQRKVGDYLKMGVSYIWVIDPRERDAVIYTTSGTHVVEDGIPRTSDPDIAVPPAEPDGGRFFPSFSRSRLGISAIPSRARKVSKRLWRSLKRAPQIRRNQNDEQA